MLRPSIVVALCLCFLLKATYGSDSEWKTISPSTVDREYSAGAMVNNSMIVTGGRNTNSVSMYDAETDQWKELPPMLYKRMKHGAGAIGSILFVVGGIVFDENGNESGVTAAAEFLDLSAATPKWISIDPYPFPVHSAAVSGCNFSSSQAYDYPSLFVTGGITGDNKTTDVFYRYDLGDLQWKQEASLLFPRSRHAIACASLTWITGGVAEDGSLIDSLDSFINQRWVNYGSMPTARCDHGMWINSDTTLLLGGGYGKDDDGKMSVLSTTIAFSYYGFGWYPLARMTTPRSNFAHASYSYDRSDPRFGGEKCFAVGGTEADDTKTAETLDYYYL